MKQFKVGEAAILIQDRSTTDEKNLKHDGEECVIIGPLAWYEVDPVESDPRSVIMGYVVQIGNSKQLIVEPHELRRVGTMIQEPSAKDRAIDKMVSWGECSWRPNPKIVEELERQIIEAKKKNNEKGDGPDAS